MKDSEMRQFMSLFGHNGNNLTYHGVNVTFQITPRKESRKLLKEIDKAFSVLEPALQIVTNNAEQFRQQSPREALGILLFEAALSLVRMERRTREQAETIRDVLLHFDSTKYIPLDAIQKLMRQRGPDGSVQDPNLLSVMEQIDSQLGTSYQVEARAVYLYLAKLLFAASGTETAKQKALIDRLKPPTNKTSRTTKAAVGIDEDDSQTIEKLLLELDSLIGLTKVKQDVRDLVNFLKVQKMRKGKGLAPAQVSRHLVFYGNPGTGKTTVARLLGRLYRGLGILSKGHFVEADRSALVAGYLGQTAIKVQEIVENATGGVLFIDEAYALTSDDRDSYGQEAISTLLKLMEDKREDLVVIVAGYPEKMQGFIAANPGLRSRFNKYFSFEDYSPEEMLQIFDFFCLNAGFRIDTLGRQRLTALLTKLFNQRNEQFGNARDVRNLFEQAISNQANRIVSLKRVDQKALEELREGDIPQELPRSHLSQ